MWRHMVATGVTVPDLGILATDCRGGGTGIYSDKQADLGIPAKVLLMGVWNLYRKMYLQRLLPLC